MWLSSNFFTLKTRQEKEDIRKRLLKARANLDFLSRKRSSFAIQEKAANILRIMRPERVVCYISYRSEVETQALISWMLEKGITVLAPVTVPKRRGFEISRVESLTDLVFGYKGISVPREAKPERVYPDVVICPGVAFDRLGWRIGYGGGNFDAYLKTLPEKTYKIGLAFSLQIVEENLPAEAHDARVDAIITEKEVILIKPFS